ncbi:hypothetical protein BX616_001703 [Lobosporangium transversale]|uniref:NmrA-like domain-containing protein n=1 Tax=Lobosporangium transversale TaxID=64571 RepID=A0A1Y2H043_9FUNG|nr:hypothetical protein BCR41DRAFT_317653 [Lobosporangium transversale]KAF9903153.1 hypothetical protein BX616_001703 [Lobosporangium transversale]ORZ27929.1 hypothetical protein BCR41DRAFT_317653 [Lobosporangium transversale]|eukprot:XP_021885632.1 hypothetical protein BCR41DRAFT_317653 [Lobosporangium transversale]
MKSTPKILVVFGATGRQGGSVINYVLNHPELSKQFKLRAVTRVPSKPVAQALQQRGVEVVKGDLYDKESLKDALRGAYTVFGATFTEYDDSLYAKEIIQGKNLADAVDAAGVQYIIFSTSRHPGETSNGKHPHVHGLNAKANIEKYIRSLPIKSAFFLPSIFFQNFYSFFTIPQPQGDGTFTIFNVVSPQSVFEFFDPVADTGKFVGAILAEPEKFESKTLCAAATFCSFEEVAGMISKATGKIVKYKQVPVNEFNHTIPATYSQCFIHIMLYLEEFGFFESKEHVEWSTENIHDKLTTFEEFLLKNPLHL